MEQFVFTRVDDEALMAQVLELRYRVYCEERGFEEAEDYPDGKESDIYDRNAVHFAALSGTNGTVLGTMRMIMPSADGLPIEKNALIEEDLGTIRGRVSEMSRLAVSRQLRAGECCPGPQQAKCWLELSEEEVRLNHCQLKEFCLVLGLFECAYLESKKLGLTHWYGFMSRGLHALLRRRRVPFRPIGPFVDYHGRRRPYLASIAEFEESFVPAYQFGRSQQEYAAAVG